MATTKAKPAKKAVVKKQAVKKSAAKKAPAKKTAKKPEGCVDCKEITASKKLSEISIVFYEKGLKIEGKTTLPNLMLAHRALTDMIRNEIAGSVTDAITKGMKKIAAKKSPAKKSK